MLNIYLFDNKVQRKKMKVILSKKGIDTNCCTSPIIAEEEKEMVFVPIPSLEDKQQLTYNDKRLNYNFLEIMQKSLKNKEYSNLTFEIKVPIMDGKLKIKEQEVFCHLDPQLKNYFIPDNTKNESDFYATFGPKLDLINYLSVEKNDIFLFFGYYSIEKQPPKHIIWGYMKVDDIINLQNKQDREIALKKYPCVKNNPHWSEDQGCIYIAKNNFGIFNYKKELDLTTFDKTFNPNKNLCKWKVTDLKNVTIKKSEQSEQILQFDKNGLINIPSTFRQEFVLEGEVAYNWANKLIDDIEYNKR